MNIMKSFRISYILFIAFFCHACTTVHKTEYVMPGWPEPLSLSETQINFPPEGGTKTIMVASRYGQCTLDGVPEWLDYELDSTKLVLETSRNYSEELLSATIRISATDGESSAEDTLRVIQFNDGYEDLSSSGTSNCYIVSPGGGSYRFIATVKGSGNEVSDGTGGSSGLGVYISSYGVSIGNACSAQLLWETVPDGDLTSSHDVIAGKPEFCDGYIYFRTGNHAGNALIAVCDASGEILWSWHIWSPETEPGTSEYNGYTWLNRNLGASNNEPGDIGNRGLLYQWGRKDPFIPSPAPYGENYGGASDRQNNSIGDGTLAQDFISYNGLPYDEAPGNIPYSVRHPATYINFAGYQSHDWYAYSYEDNVAFQSFLWGDPASSEYSKSIFDPCPPGYVVAPDGAFAKGDAGTLQGWKADNYGYYWESGNGDYFPMPGYLAGTMSDSQGPLVGCGAIGAYWLSTPSSDSSGSYFVQLNTAQAVQLRSYKVYAFSIRCVKEGA